MAFLRIVDDCGFAGSFGGNAFAPGMPEGLLTHDAWIVLCKVQARFTLFFSLGRIRQ
jgi:hypothetical protein